MEVRGKREAETRARGVGDVVAGNVSHSVPHHVIISVSVAVKRSWHDKQTFLSHVVLC